MNSFKINSNTYAMDALRQLNAVNSKVAIHQARLSTGKRINNVQDDAAAYAVIQKSYNTIKSNQVIKDGVRNGKNLLTMIEASMTTQMELWQRIKELDLQKSSGTLTNNQKAMIDERINSLIAELDDIANSTKWNGESLLNGTKSSIDIMVGEGEMMTIALPNTTSTGLGISTNSNTKSLLFDGVDDFVTIDSQDMNDLFKGNNKFTVSGWVFGDGDDSNGYNNIFSKGNNPSNNSNPRTFQMFNDNGPFSFILYSDNNNYIRIQADDDFLKPNEWAHIVGTYGGGNTSDSLKLYKNGSLVNNYSSTDRGSFNGMNENSDPFFIGARVNDNGTGHLLWDDKIDEVSILNDELSSEEVVSLYNSGNPKSPLSLNSVSSNVIGYYNMEGGDNTLVDQSSNSNNGTIIGATRSSDNPGNITNTSISNTTTERLLSHLQTIGSKIQRLESKEEALMDQTTAQEAVRSSIEDADFAEEQMELIKAQIMQQTATAALSQANTAPNIVLSLFEA